MPRPSHTPDWASDANYPAGSDPWSATPTKVQPDPSDETKGFVPATRPPAQWWNWILNLLSSWAAYNTERIDERLGGADGTGEWAYPSARGREIRVSLQDAAAMGPTTLTEGWRLAEGGGYSFWQSTADEDVLLVPLNAYLRDGMLLEGVDLWIDPGLASSGRTSGMELFLIRQTLNFAGGAQTNENLATLTDNGGAGGHARALAPFPDHYVDRGSYEYFVRVQAGNDGGSHVPDVIRAIRIRVSDPGPRNY